MTYLEIVNGVLRRLRENTVGTVQQTVYSRMVGDFVNDAKDLVEASWDWSANREIISIDTVDGTGTYSLTGYGQNGKILTAWNDTSNWVLQYKPQAWFDQQNYRDSASSGDPYAYTFRGVDASDDSQVEVYPTPNKVVTLKFNAVTRQPLLSSDGTNLTIPYQPVLHLAVAMLAEEKGEAGGFNSARYFEMADKHLSDAIAFDAAKHPAETIWYTP